MFICNMKSGFLSINTTKKASNRVLQSSNTVSSMKAKIMQINGSHPDDVTHIKQQYTFFSAISYSSELHWRYPGSFVAAVINEYHITMFKNMNIKFQLGSTAMMNLN